jgi:hypothetical protein
MLLSRKPERKGRVERPRCRWVDNIKMDIGELGSSGLDWSNLSQD